MLKHLLAIPFIFMGCLWCAMWGLRDIHKREIRNESDAYPFAVIVQSAKGINVLWGREELNQFVTENNDVRFFIQPDELVQVKNYCKERDRAIGVSIGPILNAKQVIELHLEGAMGLYEFAYAATSKGITPLSTNRFTIIDGITGFGGAALGTGIILFIIKKARRRLLLTDT